jgi:hypothetical protein
MSGFGGVIADERVSSDFTRSIVELAVVCFERRAR